MGIFVIKETRQTDCAQISGKGNPKQPTSVFSDTKHQVKDGPRWPCLFLNILPLVLVCSIPTVVGNDVFVSSVVFLCFMYAVDK